MRTIFSVRFVAAVVAVVGMFFLLLSFVDNSDAPTDAAGQVVQSTSAPAEVEPTVRRVDFVDRIRAIPNGKLAVANGEAVETVEVIIDDARRLRILEGTPGEQHCTGRDSENGCAVLADLLGDAVVWFAIVPAGSDRSVVLPAIDELVDGQAILVNGWSLPYAPILDRRCLDDDDPSTPDEFASYAEFRSLLGDNFTSMYDLDERELSAVTCRERVGWIDGAMAAARTREG